MSGRYRNFNSYNLGDNVYETGDRLLPEMAKALDYDLGEEPSEEKLKGFIAHIGPSKWLQDNIELVQERLSTKKYARALASDWVGRSGALMSVNRSFTSPAFETPSEVDAAFITGGVARWMLRRGRELVKWRTEGGWLRKVYLPVGVSEMKPSEHDLVETLANREGRAPMQWEFAKEYLIPMLGSVGLKAELVADIDHEGGTDVMRSFTETEGLTSGTVLAVCNAPSAIQTAGQFRLAAREVSGKFDSLGDQLFMIGDSFPVARNGEKASTHQNPFTALGQIARNALYLYRNSR